jgi:transposase
MANNLVSMQQIRVLIQHLKNGVSNRKIGFELSISRNTVNEYASRLKASGYSLEELQKLDNDALSAIIYAHAARSKIDAKIEDFKSRVPKWLLELTRTGVTKLLLWEEYKLDFPEGYEYSQFCELLSANQKVKNATMHFTYQPGVVMMVDFAGKKLSYVDKETGLVVDQVYYNIYYIVYQ